jgi:Flp pilus assembly pilin Flp
MNLSEWMEFAKDNWRKQEGQTMAEYGVILAVITGGIVLALTALSGGVQKAIGNVVKTLGG